ncbi:MAG: hypothetical protein R2771_02730 [Saprospiraceae bacterium]
MLKSKISPVFILLLLSILTYSQSRVELEKERLKIIDKIEFTKGILKRNESDKEKTVEYLNAIQIQIENRKRNQKNIESQLNAINKEVTLKQYSLDSVVDTKRKINNALSEIIRANYIHNLSQNKFLYLFSAQSWDDFLNRKRYLKQFNYFAKNKLLDFLIVNQK